MNHARAITMIGLIGVLRSLEGQTPSDTSEISPDPDLVPDRWRAIDDGHFDDEEE